MGAAMGASAGMNLLGAGGNVMGSIVAQKAINDATKNQGKAIDNIRAYTQAQMDPALVNEQALAADTAQAKNRLALQAQIDPELAKQRTVSEQMLSSQLGGIGSSDSDKVAAAAAAGAVAGDPALESTKQQLVAAAMQELQAGAKLPSDVQAQLMQAGLQQSGNTTGAASGASGGVGSSILSQVLGTAGIQLQAQRETQAASLATAAGNLDAQRQQILQGLFPKLQQQQMGNISATSGILQQSNAMLPQAGMSGTQTANLWLARVGAMNNLASQKAQVQYAGTLGYGQARASMIGSIASLGQGGGGQQSASNMSSMFGSSGAGAASSGGGGDTGGFGAFGGGSGGETADPM